LIISLIHSLCDGCTSTDSLVHHWKATHQSAHSGEALVLEMGTYFFIGTGNRKQQTLLWMGMFYHCWFSKCAYCRTLYKLLYSTTHLVTVFVQHKNACNQLLLLSN